MSSDSRASIDFGGLTVSLADLTVIVDTLKEVETNGFVSCPSVFNPVRDAYVDLTRADILEGLRDNPVDLARVDLNVRGFSVGYNNNIGEDTNEIALYVSATGSDAGSSPHLFRKAIGVSLL